MAITVTAYSTVRRWLGGTEVPYVEPPQASRTGESAPSIPSFDQIYDEHLAFVWRSMQRLGVRAPELDDAIQEVFLVIHRRLPTFEGRSSVKTWVFGIVLRVARTFRRTARRHPEVATPTTEEDCTVESRDPDPLPDEQAEHHEAVRLLDELLEEIGEEKREVFILAELEQMTAPEISEAVGISVTNVYARLTAARRAFEQALGRRRARDAWRQR